MERLFIVKEGKIMNGDIHIQQVQLRQKRNLILFIISYVINNLASGILYDTYVNYLQEVSLPTATFFLGILRICNIFERIDFVACPEKWI